MTITVDGRERIEGSFIGVVIANGCYAGGGMALAPRAQVDDGLLEVVLLRDMKLPSRLLNFPKIYVGKHIDLPWVHYRQARHVTVTSPETVLIEADGELLGTLPCTVEVMPRSVNIKSSHNFPSTVVGVV
jgi:diacylglycerol kinase (ATP)